MQFISDGDCRCCDSGADNIVSNPEGSNAVDVFILSDQNAETEDGSVDLEDLEGATNDVESNVWVSSEDEEGAENTTNGIVEFTLRDQIDVTLVQEQSYCVDHFQLSLYSDSLNDCVSKTLIEKRCIEG